MWSTERERACECVYACVRRRACAKLVCADPVNVMQRPGDFGFFADTAATTTTTTTTTANAATTDSAATAATSTTTATPATTRTTTTTSTRIGIRTATAIAIAAPYIVLVAPVQSATFSTARIVAGLNRSAQSDAIL
jgi:hypothetical protein